MNHDHHHLLFYSLPLSSLYFYLVSRKNPILQSINRHTPSRTHAQRHVLYHPTNKGCNDASFFSLIFSVPISQKRTPSNKAVHYSLPSSNNNDKGSSNSISFFYCNKYHRVFYQHPRKYHLKKKV